MIFYTGAGYLVFILFIAPLIVLGWILYKFFGIDKVIQPWTAYLR